MCVGGGSYGYRRAFSWWMDSSCGFHASQEKATVDINVYIRYNIHVMIYNDIYNVMSIICILKIYGSVKNTCIYKR